MVIITIAKTVYSASIFSIYCGVRTNPYLFPNSGTDLSLTCQLLISLSKDQGGEGEEKAGGWKSFICGSQLHNFRNGDDH